MELQPTKRWGLLGWTPRRKPREFTFSVQHFDLFRQFSCIWTSFHSTVHLKTAVCTTFWPVRCPPKHLDKLLLEDWLQCNISPSLFQKVEPILALGPHFWPSVWYHHLDCNKATSSRLTTRQVNKLWQQVLSTQPWYLQRFDVLTKFELAPQFCPHCSFQNSQMSIIWNSFDGKSKFDSICL